MRPRTEVVDSRFLLYAYLGSEFQDTIRRLTVHGATVDRIPLVNLSSWSIKLPALVKQRAIAVLLGALDDKIALNERIATSYEQLLRARFAALGCDVDVDEDHTGRVDELIEFNPRRPRPTGRDAVYVDMAVVPTATARIRRSIRRPARSGSRFSNGDTIMARITPCLENGKTAFVDFLDIGEVGIGSTEFIVMRSRPGVPLCFSYFLARSPRFRKHAISNMVGSSGRQRCPVEVLERFPLQHPNPSRLQEFGADAEGCLGHLKSLDCESQTLAELRDALLPRLVSGELGIKEGEKVVEEAV